MAIVRKCNREFISSTFMEEKASDADIIRYRSAAAILDELAAKGILKLTKRSFTEKVRDVEAEVNEILLCFDGDDWIETGELMTCSGLDRETVISRCLELADRGILDKRLPDSSMRPGSGNGYSFRLLLPQDVKDKKPKVGVKRAPVTSGA